MKVTCKKIIAALIFSIVSSSIFSLGMDSEKRRGEFQLKVPVSVSNSAIGLSEIFVENLVIDVNKFANDLPSNGLLFDFDAKPEVRFGVNVMKMIFGVDIGVETYGTFGLSKSLFQFIANGNGSAENVSFGGDVQLDAFAFTNLSFGMEIAKHKFIATGAFFIPAVHATPRNLNVYLENNSSGSLLARADAQVDVYSIFNAEPIFNKECTEGLMLENMGSGLGFDIAGEVQREIIPGLMGAAYVQCPIVPGRLNHKIAVDYSAEFKTKEGKSVSDLLVDLMTGGNGSEIFDDPKFTAGELRSDNNVVYNINRPFKLGAKVEWNPFGNWFNVRGMLGMGVKCPFSNEASFYLDYAAGVNFNLGRVFEAGITTQRINEVFAQNLALILNLYVFQLDVGVSLSSPSFVGCFKGAGVGAYVAFTLGA